MQAAAIGIGSNLDDPPRNVHAAVAALSRVGLVRGVSRFYCTKAWGVPGPDFCNAVALVETELPPRALLAALKDLERELGRSAGERWGPRVIDLDILTYGEERIDEADLQVPHARLFERAFALVPLAEVDARFAAQAAGLPPGERESLSLMSEESMVARVRQLAQAFLETDLMRLRIEDASEDAIEFRRKRVAAPPRSQAIEADDAAPPAPVNLDAIKADLVGIFHFARPAANEGDRIEGDRELAYVEALGIRNPVRSLGGGRIAAVHADDGDAVEYGQVLFEIDRG